MSSVPKGGISPLSLQGLVLADHVESRTSDLRGLGQYPVFRLGPPVERLD